MTSYYYVQPAIDTWIDKLDPFNVHFEAHDENNVRVSNRQFLIKYDICDIDNTPDLSNKTPIPSDKDGNINLRFEEKCRVSIVLYIAKIFDPQLDLDDQPDWDKYDEYVVCDNYIIPFEPYIIDMQASYISKLPITVFDTISRKYIQVLLTRSDKSTSRFTIEKEQYNDFIVNPTTVSHIDENTINISYTDPLMDRLWECEIIVIGKIKELAISASYIPQYSTQDLNSNGLLDDEIIKDMYSLVNKDEICVIIVLNDGYQEYTRVLGDDEWEFTSFPRITNVNMGIFKIARNNLTCEVRVPFIWEPEKYKIDAWYEGYPVKVGEEIKEEDFRIYLYYAGNLDKRLIPLSYCILEPDDKTIAHTGWNWYTIKYNIDSHLIEDKVAIWGYNEIVYPYEDFWLLYLNPTTHSFEDVTILFDKACTIMEKRYFNWGKILDRIVELAKYGTYKLHAPVSTGLSTRCDTEWIIRCTYKKAIKAKLIKVCT